MRISSPIGPNLLLGAVGEGQKVQNAGKREMGIVRPNTKHMNKKAYQVASPQCRVEAKSSTCKR